MNCRHCLIATLLLFLGIATAQPVEPGALDHPKDPGKGRASNPATNCESEAGQNGGWHLVLPGTATPQPWRTSPAVFLDRLWAISARGIVAETHDAIDWRERILTPPFASPTPLDLPDYQMVAHARALWVMTHHNTKPDADSPTWKSGGLWSSRNGEIWNDVSEHLPELVGKAILGSFGESLVLFDTSSVWTSPDGLTWTNTSPNAPWGPRNGFSITVHDGALFLLGGRLNAQGDDGIRGMCTDVWKSTDAVRWECVANKLPLLFRISPTLASYGGKLWLTGGMAGTATLSDTWVSEDGRNWNCESLAAPWNPRYEMKAVTFKGALWLFGGRNESGLVNDALWSTHNGRLWQEPTPRMPWGARTRTTIVHFKDSWWMLGGVSAHNFLDKTLQREDIWRTKDWRNWEHAGALPTEIKGKQCQILAGQDALWIVTLTNQDGSIAQEVWHSPDGMEWSHFEIDRKLFPQPVCAVNVLGKKLVVFTEPLRTYAPLDKTGPWNVYTTRNGKRWKHCASIPYPADDDEYTIGTYGHPGVLWAFPEGSASRALWRSTDAVHWKENSMAALPEPCHRRQFLWHDDQLWLIDADWKKTNEKLEIRSSFNLTSWWRSKNGSTWERVPYAREPRTDLPPMEYDQVFVNTNDGLIMVDTNARRVYRWDPAVAAQCYTGDSKEPGVLTGSDFLNPQVIVTR